MRAVLVAILVLAASSGCVLTSGGTNDPIACTELYTEGGLRIIVNPPATFTPGRYTIAVTAGGDALELAYDVAADRTATCVAPCEDAGVNFMLDRGLALDDDRMIAFVTDTSRSTGPVTALLRISDASAVLHAEQLHPLYRTTEPNGRGCGQVSNAEMTVSLP